MKEVNQIKELIADILGGIGWMTYPQIIRYLESKGVPAKGDYQLEIQSLNVELWGSLSKPVVEAIIELLNEQEIDTPPAPLEMYLPEGFPLNRPMVRELPSKKLESPAIHLTVIRKINSSITPHTH